MDESLRKTLETVSRFYDNRMVGNVGALGFRRTARLSALLLALERLFANQHLVPGEFRFLDMGCGDGRVNVLLSYLTRLSVGIEIDSWTLDEYQPLREELVIEVGKAGGKLPPDNIHLFCGDTLASDLRGSLSRETRTGFNEFELFYTYLSLYDEFARLIAREGRPGALFMIYGLDLVMPKLPGLTLVEDPELRACKVACYRKEA